MPCRLSGLLVFGDRLELGDERCESALLRIEQSPFVLSRPVRPTARRLLRRKGMHRDRPPRRSTRCKGRRLDGGPPFDRLWLSVWRGLRRFQVEAVEDRRHVDVVGLLRRDFDPVVSGLRRYGRRCDGRRFYRSRLWLLGHPELEVDVGDAEGRGVFSRSGRLNEEGVRGDRLQGDTRGFDHLFDDPHGNDELIDEGLGLDPCLDGGWRVEYDRPRCHQLIDIQQRFGELGRCRERLDKRRSDGVVDDRQRRDEGLDDRERDARSV